MKDLISPYFTRFYGDLGGLPGPADHKPGRGGARRKNFRGKPYSSSISLSRPVFPSTNSRKPALPCRIISSRPGPTICS